MRFRFDYRQSVRFAMYTGMLVVTCLHAALQCRGDEKASRSDDFERFVRPLLLNRCVECHGTDAQEAGLRLDSQEGFLRGGDSGPLIDFGTPDASRLLSAIRYDDDLRMPPDGKLPPAELRVLEDWILNGAVWPGSTATAPMQHKPAASERAPHWSFQPVQRPDLPALHGASAESLSWCQSDVDRFVMKSLIEVELTPSPPADRRTLIRRATADLHGLVPTTAEVREFEADPRPDAFRHLIDRLLESPRYGERWGRYWLDVARYSDTRGYVRLRENPVYPSAWTYRDYVIDAFNRDVPWDQFIIQQLAADRELDPNRPQDLAALGFLTLGQRFINSQNDIIDDRIDVVTRGFLGLTVTCARCHDHKYDPIGMDDYYSLHGIFASSREPDIPTLILPTTGAQEYSDYLSELKNREAAFRSFLLAQQQKLEQNFRSRMSDYLMAARTEKVQANFLPVMFLIDATKDLNPVVTQRWARLLQRTRSANHPILEPWHRLSRITAVDKHAFSSEAADVISVLDNETASGTLSINTELLGALHSPLESMKQVADVYQQLQEKSILEKHETSAWRELRSFFTNADAPATVALDDVDDFMFADASTQNQYHEQQRIVEDWIAQESAAPHAHTLEDSPQPHDSPVFLRGNASNPGRVVPRRFLRAISESNAADYSNGSGRLELAKDIASPRNPLTARVAVNRIWMHHFGTGLVPTSGDFGTRGELPIHGELLDYLAAEFVEQGWSVKSMHRFIMNSSVYQQSSLSSDTGESRDPENTRYWKMNRRRMDWEMLRDSLLFVSGDLDLKMGGPSERMFEGAGSRRRSVYGFVDRQTLPSLLRTFDFAAPEQSAPQRHQTSVPQQALFLMNSEFMRDRAISLARIIEQKAENRPEDRSPDRLIQNAFLQVYGRVPEAEESTQLVSFLNSGSLENGEPRAQTEPSRVLTRFEEICQVLLMSNEFQFVD